MVARGALLIGAVGSARAVGGCAWVADVKWSVLEAGARWTRPVGCLRAVVGGLLAVFWARGGRALGASCRRRVPWCCPRGGPRTRVGRNAFYRGDFSGTDALRRSPCQNWVFTPLIFGTDAVRRSSEARVAGGAVLGCLDGRS